MRLNDRSRVLLKRGFLAGLGALACAMLWSAGTVGLKRGLRETANVVVEAQGMDAGKSPTLAGCPIFPPENVWNVAIDHLPKDPKSAAYIAGIGPTKSVHPDFSSNPLFGIPYMILAPGTRPAVTHFEYRDESDLANYPIPPGALVESGGKPGGDNHILLLDPRRCLLFEVYAAELQKDGSWKAGSGIRIDLTSQGLRPEGWTSADAAGLPILPGLVRYDEVASGEIRHALRFTVPHTRNEFVWPARHMASHDANPNLPPMGQRFRLRADFDVAKFSKTNQVIMIAMKRYGMFLADNGGAMFVTGAPDKHWDDTDLRNLNAMKASDFEAVDESELEMTSSSARVDPLVMKRYAGRTAAAH